MNNAAALTIPDVAQPYQPGPTTIHNHAPNPIWDHLGRVASVAAGLAVLWGALWFLFWQMGSRNPGADAAGLLVYGSIAAGFLLFVSWRLGPFFDSWLGYKTEVERELTRREEVKLLAVQTTIEPGRMNEEDYNFARVILAVMMTAYGWQESSGRATFPGKWRPWSMRSALETANGIGVKLSRDRANEVSVWLHKKGVITSPESGQITPAFPDLSNVRAMLDKEFGKPIQVVSPALRDNRGFVFTD